MRVTPLLLSGGSGTRLWPLSRQSLPKQLLPLLDSQTLLQNTLQRLSGLSQTEPVIVCSQDHRFLVAEQLRVMDVSNPTILLEPVGRGTALAIAVGALETVRKLDSGLLLVLPADHDIRKTEALLDAIRIGEAQARAGKLVAFGVTPDGPQVAYGYIRKGRRVASASGNAYEIDQFVEKPEVAMARDWLAEGSCFWNSGMFMFDAENFLEELQRFEPAIYACAVSACDNAKHDLNFLLMDREAYSASPSMPVDCAVMERTRKGVVIPMDAGWKDLGSWESLLEAKSADRHGNVCVGDVLALDARESLLYSSGRLVAAVGIDNLVVVETSDALLVADRQETQRVKQVVEQLVQRNRDEAISHRRVYRPWGWYETIVRMDGMQVKRLSVMPGERISLQMHYQRSEHWVVVRGKGRVTVGSKVELLDVGQYAYIPKETIHELANLHEEDLEVIEVQIGNYLGEDDIVRISDKYERVGREK